MKRRRFLSLFTFLTPGVTVQGQETDVWGKHLIEFNITFAEYFRKYFGCPPDAVDAAQCKGPGLGRRDWELEKEMEKRWQTLTK